MNILKKLYRFLGSVQLAVTLIAISASFIIAGTWVESRHQSHLSAVQLVYQNPVFKILLLFFFVNILVSTLHRWPFRYKHIPFLTTHLGLLMILAGVFIKNTYGVQGSMEIVEGSGSHTFFIPDSYAIYVEKKEPKQSQIYEIKRETFGNLKLDPSFEPQIELLGYAPNSFEKNQTWIHGQQGVISGLKPFKVHNWDENNPSIVSSAQVRLHHSHSNPWRVFAYHSSKLEELAQEIYLHTMTATLSLTENDQLLLSCSLKEALKNPVIWEDGIAHFTLNWKPSPNLIVEGTQKQTPFKIKIDLTGPDSLLNQNKHNPAFGKAPVCVDLVCQPSLTFIKNDKDDVHFFAFDSNGEQHTQVFPSKGLEKMVLYDKGFGGYFSVAEIPFSNLPNTRKDKEAARLHHAMVQLRLALREHPTLSPPLEEFLKATTRTKQDFASQLFLFLDEWNKQNNWLFYHTEELPQSLTEALNTIDWSSIPDYKVCCWLCRLCEDIELKDSVPTFLQTKKGSDNPQELLETLTQRIYTLSEELPDIHESIPSATLFSAYLRLFSIHLGNLKQMPGTESQYFATQLFAQKLQEALAPLSTPMQYIALIEELPENAQTLKEIRQDYQNLLDIPNPSKEELINFIQTHLPIDTQQYSKKNLEADLNAPQRIQLESPLKWVYAECPALAKLEDNCPLVKLGFKKDHEYEILTLRHESSPAGLKFPLFKGEYAVRFQPVTREIPYHLRLREAKQIHYAHSSQTHSYECHLSICPLGQDVPKNIVLSMNNVYETWDGFRFYLANMTPATSSQAKRVHIVVNYDPAKYLLTYPGALIVSIGILLLFWMNPYRSHDG